MTQLHSLIADGALALGDGYRTKSSELAPDGIPVLRVGDICDGSIEPSFKDRVRSDYRSKMGERISRLGDVVITTKGTVGRVAMVNKDLVEHVYSPQVCYLRVLDRERIDPHWLYYWARSSAFDRQARAVMGQTDMAPYISLGDLRAFTIDLPPIGTQKQTAGVLGAFDDLIHTDRVLSADLDEVFLTLTRRVSLGAPVEPMREHIEVSKGLSYKGAFLADAGRPMMNLANFGLDGRMKPGGTKYYAGEVRPRHILARGDLVIANTDLTQRRELLGRPLLVPSDGATASHHTFIAQTRTRVEKLWVYAQLRLDENRMELAASATGTTVAALPADVLLSLEVPWPAAPILEAWGRQAVTILDAIDDVNDEIVDLALARDELLPLLMGGSVHVHVPEAAERFK